MSNRVTNTPKKPAPGTSGPKPGAPAPRKRAGSIPIAAQPRKARRDWWPWNLMGGLVLVILGTGALVWGLRAVLSSATPAAVATPLPGLPTREPRQGTPVVGAVATPTFAAPDALNSGPYAAVTQIASSVSTAEQEQQRPSLPPEVPAPHLALSTEGHDWGRIAASGLVSHTITVANPGNRPLQIDKLLSDCGCLSGVLSANNLPIGNRATLVVLYDPGLDGKKGLVERTLTILSNAGDTPVKTLSFKATVP